MLGKFIKMCLLMICVCCTAYGYEIHDSNGHMENGKEDQLNKCYLSYKNVEISDNKILYVTEENITPLTQLFSDEFGIYTIVEDQKMTAGLWNCPKPDCRALNSGFTMVCKSCGWPN